MSKRPVCKSVVSKLRKQCGEKKQRRNDGTYKDVDNINLVAEMWGKLVDCEMELVGEQQIPQALAKFKEMCPGQPDATCEEKDYFVSKHLPGNCRVMETVEVRAVNKKYVEWEQKFFARRTSQGAGAAIAELSDFRFLQALGCDTVAASPASMDTLDEKKADAKKQKEVAELEELKLLLQHESTRYQKHQEEMARAQTLNAAERAEALSKMAKRNEEAIQRELEDRYPCRELKQSSHIQPFVQSAVSQFAMRTNRSVEDLWQVWWAAFPIAGSRFLMDAAVTIRNIADVVAQKPLTACTIVVAPNTGVRGGGCNDAALLRAEKEVTAIFEDPDLRIIAKRLALTCDEASIPNQSERNCFHTAWMVISDQSTADGGSLASAFTKSMLWRRGGVTQLEALLVKDMVNPLARMNKADFNATKDLSRSLRRKQEHSGYQYVSGILA